MNDDFAATLIYLRGEKNLTQQELGDAAGVSPSQISRYESGTAYPRKTVLRKLANALDVPVDRLSKPDMVTLLIDEPELDLWRVSIPRALKDDLEAQSKEHGVGLEVMFAATLERAKDAMSGADSKGIDHYIALVTEYYNSIEK